MADVITIGRPILCPSPWPGAPSTTGFSYATPGYWEVDGTPSKSLPKAIVGPPSPFDHVASHEVGIPEIWYSTSNPFSSRILPKYFDVSNSWNPSSPKLKTLSIITCVIFLSSSTNCDTSSLRFSIFLFENLFCDWRENNELNIIIKVSSLLVVFIMI